MRFIIDIRGRIPFAVLGVMLIFGSIITSTVITSLEKEYAKGISYALPSEKEKYFIWYVEADLARALDKAARKALKEIGRTPVTDATSCQVEEFKRADNIDPTLNTLDNKELATTVNINRVRYHTLKTLKNYILLNFYYDSFQIERYIINVKKILGKDVKDVSPKDDFLNVEVDIITMNIGDRPGHPLGGVENSYHTYMKMGLPVEIEVKNLSTGKTIFVKETKINTLVMNRFLLLEDMTRDFEDNLQTFGNLGIEALASIMLLTWTRGYLQWATSFGGKAMPANIISNQWVAIATTGAILLEEGFVFNAADPLGPLYVGYETADAIFFDITGEHLKELMEMVKEGADLASYMITQVSDINKIAVSQIEEIKKQSEEYNNLLGDRWKGVTQDFTLNKLVEDAMSQTMEGLEARIKDVYKSSIFMEVSREKLEGNREKINAEIEEKKRECEDKAIEMKDEAEGKAKEKAQARLTGSLSIVSCNMISVSTTNENVDEGAWQLVEENTGLLTEEGFFDNSNPNEVIIGGEKWTVNRTRTVTFSWITKATWKVTVTNGTDTVTVSVETENPHSEYKEEWSREYVTIKFISDLYAHGSGDIGKNDIQDPFQKKSVGIFQGESYENIDDPNLDGMLSIYKNKIGWNTENPFTQTQKNVFEGNNINDYRMEVSATDDNKIYPHELVRIVTTTLQNLKEEIVEKVVVNEKMGPDNPVTDPGQFLSEVIGKLKNKFEDNMDNFIAQSKYMENDHYLSAAAKVVYLMRKDFVETIHQKLMDGENNAKKDIKDSYKDAKDSQMKRKEAEGLNENVKQRNYENNVNDAEKAKNLLGETFVTEPKTMKLIGDWEEKVGLVVYQKPHFISPEKYIDMAEEEPRLLQEVTLTYRNINIFSPLQGILDNLIDMGFDALNKQVFDAIDEGFDKIEELLTNLDELNTVTYVDENGNEVTEKYDIFTQEDVQEINSKMNYIAQLIVEGKEGNKGVTEKLVEKIHEKMKIKYWWIIEEEVLSKEEVREIVTEAVGEGDFKTRFENIKNEEAFEERIIEAIKRKLEEKVKNEEIDEVEAENLKHLIESEIEDVYKKAVSEAIDAVRDEVKNAFEDLSEKLSEKLKNKLEEKLQKELMEKIGDKIKRQIQSTCGGIIPAGLPVLPPFGWWCTINAWVVNVEGNIPYFEVVDTMHFPDENPIFGHEAQTYVRNHTIVYTEEDFNGDDHVEILGKNTPIKFGYTTGSFIIVPPGGTGVGDRVGGYIETEEFKG